DPRGGARPCLHHRHPRPPRVGGAPPRPRLPRAAAVPPDDPGGRSVPGRSPAALRHLRPRVRLIRPPCPEPPSPDGRPKNGLEITSSPEDREAIMVTQ